MENIRLKMIRTAGATLLCVIITMAAVSPTSGLDWSSEWWLTANIAWDVNPSVMQATDGTIWVVWSSDREEFQNDLYYKTSSDNGLSWSPATPLTSNSSSDLAPSIMQATDGTIWVVWSSDRTGDYEIWYKTSQNNGLTWSDATRLTTNSSRDMEPSILQAADGTIWVVWHRSVAGQSDLYYKISPDNGQTWSNDTRLTTDPSWDRAPSITQTRNGTIWVAWSSYRTDDYEIFYKTSPDNGQTWSNDTRLTTEPGFDEMPSVVQTVNGSIWVFWASDRMLVWDGEKWVPQYDIFYKTSRDHGQTWSNDAQLTTDPKDDWTPSTTNTQEGTIWVVWSSIRTDNFEIWYKISDVIPAPLYIGSVAPSVTEAYPTWTIQVNVTVINKASSVDCRVTAYYSADQITWYEIETKNVTLASNENKTLTLSWNLAEVAPRVNPYHIKANVIVIGVEDDYLADEKFGGTVKVRLMGDVDGDDDVDIIDVGKVAMTFAKGAYNVMHDVDRDGDVDIIDVGKVAMAFAKGAK